MSGTILITGNRLEISGDTPDLEELRAYPGAGVRGQKTENKQINKKTSDGEKT